MRGAGQASRTGNAELAGQLYELAVDGVRIAGVPVTTRLDALVGLATGCKRAGHDHQDWQACLAAAELGWEGGDVIGAAEAIIAVGSNSLWSWREYQTVDVAAVALLRRLLEALPPDYARLEGLLRATWRAGARAVSTTTGDWLKRPDSAPSMIYGLSDSSNAAIGRPRPRCTPDSLVA